MAVQAKNRDAADLNARAEALRAELADADNALTSEEVTNKLDEIRAIKARAQAMAEFTATDEMTRQGAGEMARVAPNGGQDEAPMGYKEICDAVRREFGGPNAYLLALAREGEPKAPRQMTERQKALHRKVEAFHQRDIIGDTGDATGGEYLLPLQQVPSIWMKSIAQDGILGRCRTFPVAGRSLRLPILDQYDAANTRPEAGIAAISIVGEGSEKPEKEPQFLQRLLTIYKYAAYTEAGDEILADDFTGDLSSTLQAAVGGEIVNKVNGDLTVDGSGSSQPLGAIHANNGARLIVNRTTSSSVTVTDVLAMEDRFVDGPQSFWLAHVSLKSSIYGMQLSSGSNVTFLRDLNGTPQAFLMGRPIVWTHLNAPKSGVGDLSLINGDFYACAIRQALTVNTSIHYKFRNDLTAYRFVMRAGGIPIPTGTYSYKASGSVKTWEVSPFVVLGDDAAS